MVSTYIGLTKVNYKIVILPKMALDKLSIIRHALSGGNRKNIVQGDSESELQRGYKKVLKKANRVKEPIIVIANNKLQGAIIGLDQLEEIRLNAVAEEAIKDYREGRTKSISNLEELEADFEEMKKEAGLSK